MRRDEEVLFAVDDFTAELWEDDRVLRDAIERRGVTVVPTVWGSAVPVGSTVVVRSTWDYIHQPDRFARWLDSLDVTVNVDGPATRPTFDANPAPTSA